MPKQSPVPDELTKPFWDGCNEGRLVLQNCKPCHRLNFPAKTACTQCGSGDNFEWREVKGLGKITGYGVVNDSRIRQLQEQQPFNLAVISLYEDPEILFYSHLPGLPPNEVPIGADVEVFFEDTPATGQKVPEWLLV